MRIIFLILFASVLASACRTPRYSYAQSAANVPILTKKGDSKLGATYSTNGSGTRTGTPLDVLPNSGISRGYDVQGAYAITDKFAVQASFFHRYERNGYEGIDTTNDIGSLISYRRNFTEAGFGYYTPVDKQADIYFQIFGGVGFGKFNINERGNDNNGKYNRFHYSNVTKYYIQPAFTFGAGDFVHFGLSSRFSLVKYNNIKTSYSDSELVVYELAQLPEKSFLFWEPAFTNTFEFRKLKGLKLEWQFGKSFRMSKTYLDRKTFNLSIGAFLDLPKLLSKK